MKRYVSFALLFVLFLAASGSLEPAIAQGAPAPAASMQAAPSAGFEAAMKLYRRRHYTEAIQAFDAVLQSESGNAAAYYFKGYAQYVTRQYSEALASFSQAFQAEPSFDPRPYFHRR